MELGCLRLGAFSVMQISGHPARLLPCSINAGDFPHSSLLFKTCRSPSLLESGTPNCTKNDLRYPWCRVLRFFSANM